ncbi:hypothetical protein PCANC_15981 [Puccinia coronata f. sp. avenae]|uniref:Uncharacterized protein n=1 Tax=Puccinia coronata f. sp. avenae TaxID=200324 RepID=A0A2N5VRX3_9BASI|nr:hypothetical protein PCANC_15981 [Puccinia coronata f. sp. avenae]
MGNTARNKAELRNNGAETLTNTATANQQYPSGDRVLTEDNIWCFTEPNVLTGNEATIVIDDSPAAGREFKQGGGKKSVGSSDPNPPHDSSSVQRSPPGGVCGKQLANDGSPPHPSESKPSLLPGTIPISPAIWEVIWEVKESRHNNPVTSSMAHSTKKFSS